MSFVRKRSIDLKSPHLKNNMQMLNSTSLSNLSQQDKYQQPSKSYNQFIEFIKKTKEGFTKLSQQKWEKQISEVLQSVLNIKNGILQAQKLIIHRQCLQLVTKYIQQLKKIGKQFNEQNSSLCIHLFKDIVQYLSKLSQQEKKDQLFFQANLTQALFDLLQTLALTAEGNFNNKQTRPTLMRKNSLKKVEDLPTVRPFSRGKLASLTKKQSITSKKDILDIRPPSRQEQASQKTLFQQLIFKLCFIVKNLSANTKVRPELMKQEYLRIINRYLCMWNDKNLTSFGTSLMIQLTSCYRHLVVEDKLYKVFLKSNCFDTWARLVQFFPTSNDIIFNILRVFSRVSGYESCCLKLNQKKQCLKNLCGFLKLYKNHIHIIIRIAVIFGNLTSYIADIRNQIYFEFQAWKDIYVCFDYYATAQLSGKNQTKDDMNKSRVGFDNQAIKNQSDIQATIKIIRLIANLFTVNAIGSDIYLNDSQSYKQLVKKLKGLLQKRTTIQKSNLSLKNKQITQELIACTLSCLTNVLYYDKQMMMSNPQYKLIKIQLVNVLVDFVVQIDNQQICCESLRVISNITRMKELVKSVLDAKIHQAVVILLQSTSKQIVYYSLGILINLLVDDDFKQQYKEIIINGVLDILNECESQDFDLATVGLKTLACIFDARNQNIDPEVMGRIQTCLVNLIGHCDRVMIDKEKQNTLGELNSIQQSRSLINMLLNNMPEQKYTCPIKNCGRRFADDLKLQDHLKRRHKTT